jgi:ribosomal protein S18 acetylase RimI-like enzyme
MKRAKSSGVTIRRLERADSNEAGRFSARMFDWMWHKYEKGHYPKEGIEFDIWDWSPAKIRKRLDDPDLFGFVAEADGEICGLVMTNVYGKSGYAFINWIAVDPSHQHEGIGIKLMIATEEQLKKLKCHKIGLYTLPSLVPAVRLYMKFGLLPEANLRQQWWGADFLLMSKWIGKYRKH